MNWSLHTDSPAHADGLAAELQKSVESWLRGRRRDFAQNILNDVEPQTFGDEDEIVAAQMKGAIQAAVDLATIRGGKDIWFRASLSGHADADHSDGITERLSVALDIASDGESEQP